MAKSTRVQVKALQDRCAALRAEMTDAYTVSLGPAAVNCVRESLEVWTAELDRVMAGQVMGQALLNA